jgi:hypothetical protein
MLGALAELVALDQRDTLEMPGERTRRAESGHAAAQNNRVPSCSCHDVDPPYRALRRPESTGWPARALVIPGDRLPKLAEFG